MVEIQDAQSDEPHIEISFYAKGPDLGPGTTGRILGCRRFPVSADEISKSQNMSAGGILCLPEMATEYMRLIEVQAMDVRPDQIARICTKLDGKAVVSFFVEGVVREGLDHGPNSFRPFAEADKDWVTVSKWETGQGVFDMSGTARVGEWLSRPGMERHIVGPNDRIVRLIGEDFVVLDPQELVKQKPVPAEVPAGPR